MWMFIECTVSIILFNCADIDECLERPEVCSNGDCLNLVGSFSCLCNNGFRLTPNRETCVGKYRWKFLTNIIHG